MEVIGSVKQQGFKRIQATSRLYKGSPSTVIDGDVANAINLGGKSIQTISAGNRYFRWGEAKNTAKYFIEAHGNTKGIDSTVFRVLLRNFLIASANADTASGISEDMVDKFLIDELGIPVMADSQTHKQYSNLPSRGSEMLIRQSIIDNIEDGVTQDKIIFIDGFTGTGKSHVAMYYAKYSLQENPDIYVCAIWIRDTDGNLTLMGIVNEILTTFDHPNVGNMNTTDKIKTALKHLNTHKSIIIIDNFESVSAVEKDEILHFLIERLSSNTVAIITCKNRMTTYKLIKQNMERFHEVRVTNLTWEQWLRFSDVLQTSHADIKAAVLANTDLLKFVYELCEGNIYGLSHLIATISTKIAIGEELSVIQEGYSLCEIDKESHDWVVKKTISELSDNDKSVLVALSLFAAPVTKVDLSKVSGLNGLDEIGAYTESSALRTSIVNLHEQFLIEQVKTAVAVRFALPPLLRPILLGELKQNNYSQHEHIIENWIQHYRNLAATVGFCFNDFDKLKLLDADISAKEIDNLKAVLDFCYKRQRWDDYYYISENTKYYFYTRGVSGIGKQSVHYKRAYAAKMLGESIDEFNSLLYHCNVACKAKEWDGIDDCFKRVDKLIKAIQTIPTGDLMKYEYIHALYDLGKQEYEKAREHFERYESMCEPLIANVAESSELLRHDYIASIRWHSECLYHLALHETSKADAYATQAFDLLEVAIKQARPLNFERAIVHSILLEIRLLIDIKRDTVEALKVFGNLSEYKEIIEHDIMYKTEYAQIQAALMSEGGVLD